MIAGPGDVGRHDSLKAQILQFEGVDEGIDGANRIVLVDPVIEAPRQQRQLPPIRSFEKSRHPSPRRFSRGIIARSDFSHNQGYLREWGARAGTLAALL